MIKAVSMDKDEFQDILNKLPKHLKEKIESGIKELKPDAGIEIIAEFLEYYEDDDPVDHMVGYTVSNFIKKVHFVADESVKAAKAKGKPGISTAYMANIIMECLRDEARQIEKAATDHKKECCNCTHFEE